MHFNAHITITVSALINANNSAVTAQGFQNQLTATLLLSPQTKRPLLQHNCRIIFFAIIVPIFSNNYCGGSHNTPLHSSSCTPIIPYTFYYIASKQYVFEADDPISPFYLFIKSKLLVYRNSSLLQEESTLCTNTAHFSPIFIFYVFLNTNAAT